MKEVTVVSLVEITDIITMADDVKLTSDEECADRIKIIMDADDVKVKKRQLFIRDLPNN